MQFTIINYSSGKQKRSEIRCWALSIVQIKSSGPQGEKTEMRRRCRELQEIDVGGVPSVSPTLALFQAKHAIILYHFFLSPLQSIYIFRTGLKYPYMYLLLTFGPKWLKFISIFRAKMAQNNSAWGANACVTNARELPPPPLPALY